MHTARRRATVVSLLLSLTAALVAAVVAVPPAQATGGGPQHRDSAVAEGYDWHTLRTADVIAGSGGNNVVIRYTAGRAVDDGVLRIAVPKRAWPTPLHAETGLYFTSPPGAFSVRPAFEPGGADIEEPTRTPEQMCAPVEVGNFDVRAVRGAQLITVRHVTCAAGQELAVRIEGLQAPEKPRRYGFPVVATDGHGGVDFDVAILRVVRPPRIQLEVDMPSVVPPNSPFIVKVSAHRPNGTLAKNYSGAVALVSEDIEDCTMTPRDRSVAFEFTPADKGVGYVVVEFGTVVAHRIRAYDVANKALDGVSAPFEVVGTPDSPIICPVSYH